ncbi:MAG: hypothetical protein SGI87_14485 [Flavobacteriales bacterium]|nr:hypothetical protein [Flavobacteriales bacterium]
MANSTSQTIGIRYRMARLSERTIWYWKSVFSKLQIDLRIVLLFLLLIPYSLFSQQGIAIFGIQMKPMIPSKYFGISDELVAGDGLEVNFSPRFGHNFGMVIRYGISNMISFESGINIVQRNYRITINQADLPGPQNLNFRFVGYEIPIQGLVFVQIGKQMWMNASGGVSLDLYPTNVESFGEARKDTIIFDLYQKTWRNGRFQVALLANYGFEYRSKKSGYFYFGLSYHRPFSKIGLTTIEVREKANFYNLEHPLSGNYLTLDFRYFFHEEPEKKRRK